ncbi:hypothetical protein HKD42_02060 [Altererythrobacter sp. RZ02]|uniref:Beta/gamma crystallin 'Greek key' domain-containing protein n=1 Tax=Pontixanthobacter rizhaonensis TaxID=2730337 RepID=A0A848QEF3_9SPHN|nr:hypothetical protein [Pontixanthobacter rizhaonensis]NMW30842.1 hypothetical protein [Pontixanthobacter rizhaonensis]
MKLRTLFSLTAAVAVCLSAPGHAQSNESEKAAIASFAEPYGFDKGNEFTIYVPPTAHVSEIVVFYDESVDAINGVQIYYQPDINSDPVSTNYAGRLVGKQIRVSVGWDDIINGLEVETSPAGALASFLLTTEAGAKRGFQSTLANGRSKQLFGNNLRFSGLTVRADKKRVYAMGLNLVPASSVPRARSANGNTASSGGLTVFSADDTPSRSAPTRSSPPASPPPSKGSGLAGALADFVKAVERGQRTNSSDNRTSSNTRNRTTSSTPNRNTTSVLAGNTKAILYEGCNFTGKAVGLDAGAWDTAALSRLGMRNDTVSSIKIQAGYEVVASSNDYARGGVNKTFSTYQSCLVNQDFNDVLSYIRVQPATRRAAATPPRQNTANRVPAPVLSGNTRVILYEGCNYTGKAIGLNIGTWDSATLVRMGMPNDTVSSIKIQNGYEAVVSSNDYARGGVTKTLSSFQPCLTNQNFNDVLSFIRVRPASKQAATSSPPQARTSQPTSPPKPRGPEEMRWTPQGVTGQNVGAIYYDRFNASGEVNQSGRFEISEEGSNIWNWFVTSQAGGMRGDRNKPHTQLRVTGRTADTISLQDVKSSIHRFVINTRTKRIRGIQAAVSSQPELDFFVGKTTHQSRPY